MLINLVHHEMDIIIHKQIMIVQLNAEVEDRRVRDSSRMENWSQNKLVSISTHKTANIGNKMTEDAKRKKIVNIGIGILIQTMLNLWRMAISYGKFTLCCLHYCTCHASFFHSAQMIPFSVTLSHVDFLFLLILHVTFEVSSHK